jgi:thymidine kinase
MIDSVPHVMPKDTGWIEVITGCMFSGKTEELIRRLRRAQIAKQKVMIFKQIKDIHDALKLSKDAQVVGIDEAQFFSSEIIDVCNELANNGKRVIVVGLDQDYKGVPFEPMPHLLSIAEYITKSLAICVECGNPADRTQRKTVLAERVVVGAADIYEARCRKCHYIPEEE